MTDEDIEAEIILDSWCRHLYCGVFGLIPNKKKGIYSQGLYRCMICSVYWKAEDCPAFLCPCCNTKVRTKRR